MISETPACLTSTLTLAYLRVRLIEGGCTVASPEGVLRSIRQNDDAYKFYIPLSKDV